MAIDSANGRPGRGIVRIAFPQEGQKASVPANCVPQRSQNIAASSPTIRPPAWNCSAGELLRHNHGMSEASPVRCLAGAARRCRGLAAAHTRGSGTRRAVRVARACGSATCAPMRRCAPFSEATLRRSLEFAVAEHGKPYLPAVPGSASISPIRTKWHWLQWLGMSKLEWMWSICGRMPDCMAIAERFFPPSDAAALLVVSTRAGKRVLPPVDPDRGRAKARGIGLYGAGSRIRKANGHLVEVRPVDSGRGMTAAVARFVRQSP